MLPGREPNLNDPYTASTEASVDREKIFKAWEEVYKRNNKPLPPANLLATTELAVKYKDKAQQYLNQGDAVKSVGYIYFATLLLLRYSLTKGDRDLIDANRALLRSIEKINGAEQLMPR